MIENKIGIIFGCPCVFVRLKMVFFIQLSSSYENRAVSHVQFLKIAIEIDVFICEWIGRLTYTEANRSEIPFLATFVKRPF